MKLLVFFILFYLKSDMYSVVVSRIFGSCLPRGESWNPASHNFFIPISFRVNSPQLCTSLDDWHLSSPLLEYSSRTWLPGAKPAKRICIKHIATYKIEINFSRHIAYYSLKVRYARRGKALLGQGEYNAHLILSLSIIRCMRTCFAQREIFAQ